MTMIEFEKKIPSCIPAPVKKKKKKLSGGKGGTKSANISFLRDVIKWEVS